MSEYYRYLKSDIYKLRHSWFLGIHLLFPVLGSTLMLLYSHLSSGSELNKLAAFAQIIAIAYPFVISVVCQLIQFAAGRQMGIEQHKSCPQNRKEQMNPHKP